MINVTTANVFKSFMTEVLIIWKPAHWFAEQMQTYSHDQQWIRVSTKPTKNSFSITGYGDSCWKYGNWYLLLILEQLPSRHLLAQSEQLKHKNNMWNLFKVNNKDTRINFTHCSGVPLLILNRLMMAWFDLLSKYILCTLFHLLLLIWKEKKCFFTKVNSQRPKQLYIWIYI